jgi:Concanavalin A-like lectin/glucanases superfamily
MSRLLVPLLLVLTATSLRAEFTAGAAVIDITPPKLPVLVNGGMLSRYVDKINTRIHARAIVMRDGKTQIALVVADSCMIGRDLLDDAKAMAARKTGIPADRMLISATHAHSAPASMGCLGTEPDPSYVPFLKEKLVEAIAAAQANLEPARIGFAKADAAEFTALRQWIRRPDRLAEDPFGNKTVRANMHAGAKWDDAVGESGPEDPDLSLISIQTRDGKPIAVMGNFSMHYFGDKDISADYFGLFSEGLKQRIAPEGKLVGIMSHGCSGDIYRVDYTVPAEQRPKPTIDEYTNGLLDIAMKAYAGIKYGDQPDIAMAERRMTLNYRVPDKQRLEWAQRVVAEMGDRLAKTPTEVYAREQIILKERQQTEIVVQALRIGDIGIATTPCETYAITGLKIKAASPLAHNMVIELANGGDGYIPPPEMYAWGGYNTWAARSAGLDVNAEAKITAAAIGLLEKVSGKPRHAWKLSDGAAAKAVVAMKPVAYWRLNEFTGPVAADASGHGRDATYERDVAYYLEGPQSAAFCANGQKNRAPHLVGSRIRARLDELGDHYSVSMWIWNGMPNDGRDISGWFFSRSHDHGLSIGGDHLGIGGKSGNTGKLIFFNGTEERAVVAGKTEIPRWQWQHVTLVRDGKAVRVYLNGNLELESTSLVDPFTSLGECFFGGRSDNDSNWEGRIDEVTVFNRTLTDAEVNSLAVK